MSLLLAVGETYANLKSLSTEVLVMTESGDAETFDRNQRKTNAFFEAPDKIRIEQRRGHLTVFDGLHSHHYLPHANRYWKSPARSLAGLFQAHSPILSDSTFLFKDISKWVIRAESLPDESGAAVVSVLYDTDWDHIMPTVRFWVHPETRLILRAEGVISPRRPFPFDRTISTTLRFNHIAVNQPIPPETFTFTPPEGVEVEVMGPCGVGPVSGSTGEMRMSSRETIFGIHLEFERRLKISDDRKDLHIMERITTPAGQTEHELTVPVSPPATPE